MFSVGCCCSLDKLEGEVGGCSWLLWQVFVAGFIRSPQVLGVLRFWGVFGFAGGVI
jgi:hypothetical protein